MGDEGATATLQQLVEQVESALGEDGIAVIYRDRVCSQRTRRVNLPKGSHSARIEVLHTLLGIELQVGRSRLLCPDLPTARYLSLFAHLRLETVAIPYDITRIPSLVEDLESSWFRMLRLTETIVQPYRIATVTRLKRQLVERQRATILALSPT
ncbi:MAG: hypothetical protein ACOYNR_04460 [Blastocatellia bacterium]|jgi:hypothetical protein